jgi:type IV secretory pathway VirJ component
MSCFRSRQMLPLDVCGVIAALAIGVPSPAAAQSNPSPVLGLPLVEVLPVRRSSATMAVILTGDGGWAAGDRTMAATLADSGISVVGLDVPSYLRTPRDPDIASADLRRVIDYYLARWHAERVILIGYSHGADLAPFMVSRLPVELRSRIVLLAMLGLEPGANFQFHMADIIGDFSHKGALPVLPEVEKLRGIAMLCVRGSDEGSSLCSSLPTGLARVETRLGGHRISGSQGPGVVDLILRAVAAH